MVWMESMISSAGAGLAHGCKNIPNRGVAAASRTGCCPEAEPHRPQPHLLGRLLTRHILTGPPLACEARADLQQQGRFCRSPDRRRPASPIPGRCRRQSPGRTRKPARQPLWQRCRTIEPDQRNRAAAALELCLAAKMFDTSAASWTSVFHSAQSRIGPATGSLPTRMPGTHISSSAWPSAHC
jgi:hypothetical protein